MRLKDIAKTFGVATSTISRALNDDTQISRSLRKRIKEYAQRTGYRKNALARSLKTNRSNIIGFIAPELSNDFFMNVAQGVEDKLKNKGFSLIVCNSNEKLDEEKRRLELLLEHQVDGVIIIPCSSLGSHLDALSERGIPFVLVDRLSEDIESDAVLVDNTGGSYKAVEYLITHGIHKIGFIGGDMNLTSAKERFTGYTRALEDYYIRLDDSIIRFGDFHVHSGYVCMESLLNTPEPPKNVFIANFFMHLGATKFLFEQRLNNRDMVKIAGFDEMYLSPVLGFASLTVAQPVPDIGREAASILIDRIQGVDFTFPKISRLDTKLVIHDESLKRNMI